MTDCPFFTAPWCSLNTAKSHLSPKSLCVEYSYLLDLKRPIFRNESMISPSDRRRIAWIGPLPPPFSHFPAQPFVLPIHRMNGLVPSFFFPGIRKLRLFSLFFKSVPPTPEHRLSQNECKFCFFLNTSPPAIRCWEILKIHPEFSFFFRDETIPVFLSFFLLVLPRSIQFLI